MNNMGFQKATAQQPGHMDEPSAGSVPPKIDNSSVSSLSDAPIDIADEKTYLDVPTAHEDEYEDEDSTLPNVANSGDEQSNGDSSSHTFQCLHCDKSYNNEVSLKRHMRERRSKCSKDRLGAPEHGGNVFACSRCHAETTKKFSTERHINDACWKVCDECCESGHAACNAIYVDGACKYCMDNGLSCTKHTGPVRGVHYRLLSGDPTQPLKTGPKSSRSGKDPAATDEAIKRKATTSPEASPRSKPVGKKDKNEHSHLQDNITPQGSFHPQNFPVDEKLREWRRAQNAVPSNLRDGFSAAALYGSAPMSQTSRNQPGEHLAAYSRAPRLRPHFPNTDDSLQRGSVAAVSSGQPHERRANDFVASASGSRMPSRQSSAEPARYPRAPKAPVVRKLTQKVAMERSEPSNENDPVFRLRIFGNLYDVNSQPIFSILTIRASQKFGPRLDAYCHQRNKRYGVDWVFVYRYVVDGHKDHEKYIKINYDMTPLDVYDKDGNIRLRDMDTLTVMKAKSLLAAKVESDRKGVRVPSSPIGSQVSEQVIDIEDGETPFYQNAGTLTGWHRMIELKMMELRSQVVGLDSEVTHQKQLVAEREKTIAEMMMRESVIQRVLRSTSMARATPASRQLQPHRDQTATGPARIPANPRPNQFMARLESVREPAQPPMPRQPLPEYRFPTDANAPEGRRRPDNRAAQDPIARFEDGRMPSFERTAQLLRQAGFPPGVDLDSYLPGALARYRQALAVGGAGPGADAKGKGCEEKKKK